MFDPKRIEFAIGGATGEEATIVSVERRSGGSINEAVIASLADGRRFFIKSPSGAAHVPEMFEAEYYALELLRAVGAIKLPEPVAFGDDFIVTEAFHARPKLKDWQAQFGSQLATLHLTTRRENFGLDRDNYIGMTPQPNGWLAHWTDFWRERRLIWQLDRFAAAGHQGDPLIVLGWELSERLDEILDGPDEPAVLLHGDLWSGNAAADDTGAPIIFDPASYYGRREAEFGVMCMFSGFDSECFAAYEEVWPLAEGSDRRIAVYRLYHELNHLNLFGQRYYDSCLATIRSVL